MIPEPLLVVTFTEAGFWLAQGVNLDVCSQSDPGGSEAGALESLVRSLMLTHESATSLGMEPFNWGPAPAAFTRLWEVGEPVQFSPAWDYTGLPCPTITVRRVGITEDQQAMLASSWDDD